MNITTFDQLVKYEVNTEKSQKQLSDVNLRTFVCLPNVRKKAIEHAFVQSFGYNPEKINSLTFTKVINNRKSRTSRKVKMKKFFILLPKGKDLTQIKK